MGAERPERTCRFCYEPIDARAKRCPHCRMQQTRWAWMGHPVVWMALVLGLLAWLVAMTVSVRRDITNRRTLTPYEGQLVVTDSRLEHGGDDDSPVVLVYGELQNNSPVRWKDIETECRFLDAAGQLIDVGNSELMITVPPGKTRYFLINHSAALPPDSYVSHEISVRWAKEAK